ncbi:hypothetical protein MMC10_002448 [Thelotrema lepadinum]|nr:hypothetical protein [Thelotrema lepadinum]
MSAPVQTTRNQVLSPPPGSTIADRRNEKAASISDSIRPTKLEILFTWASQIFAILIAVLFGVFSILSYYTAESALNDSGQANNFADQANSLANQANTLANQSISTSYLANQLALYSLCQALLQQSNTGNTSTDAGGVSGGNSLVCTQLLDMVDMSQLVAQAFPGLVLPTPTASGTASPTTPAATALPTASSAPTALPSSGASPGSPSSGAGSAPLNSAQIGAIVGSLVGVLALIVAIFSFLRFRQRYYSYYPRHEQ